MSVDRAALRCGQVRTWLAGVVLASAALLFTSCGGDVTNAEVDDPATVSDPPSSASPSASPASADPVEAGQRAFTAWARPTVSYDQWWAELEPLLSSGGQQDFANTDPANIPPAKITGTPTQVRGRLPGGLVDEGTALVRVPTSIGKFGVYLTRGSADDPWLMLRMDFPAGVH